MDLARITAIVLTPLILYSWYYMFKNYRRLPFYTGLALSSACLIVIVMWFKTYPNVGAPLIISSILVPLATFALWKFEKKHLEWFAQEAKEREEAKKRYDEIQAANGSLQELSERPLTQKEKEELKKEKKETTIAVLILMSLAISGCLFALIKFQNIYWAGISFGFVILLIIGLVIGPKYNKRLKVNKMYILKGVISYKYMYETKRHVEYRIYIGDPEDELVFKVFVTKRQFKRLKHGDIVEVKGTVKTFTDELSKITKIGNIFDSK